MKKNFVLIFPSFSKVHFYKDVGMIPYWVSKNDLFNVSIASQSNEMKNLLKLNGINHIEVKKFSNKKTINAAIFIIFNYKKIDILHLYHLTLSTILLCFLYRIICIIMRKKYITYVKLDIWSNLVLKISKSSFKIFLKIIFRLMTIVSVEGTSDYKTLNSIKIFKNILLIPNAFTYPDNFDKFSSIKKENIILHVSRAGTYQKNTEELLEVIPNFFKANDDWVIYIVGPFTDKIKHSVNLIRNKHYSYRARLKLFGNLESREEIEFLYAKSKIIVLTSRWDTLPHALLEARRWGLKVISTRINGIDQILTGHSCSYVYDSGNASMLLSFLFDSVNDDEYFTNNLFDKERVIYSSQNNWNVNLIQLINLLKKQII